MFGVEDKMQKAARNAAAFFAGGLLAVAGSGCLTVAGWLVLAELRSHVFAATIIGLIYLGLAALTVVLTRPPHRKSTHHKPQMALDSDTLTPLQLVVLSFLQGLEQGREQSRGTRR